MVRLRLRDDLLGGSAPTKRNNKVETYGELVHLGLQEIALYLAGYGLRQFVPEYDDARILVRSGMALDVPLNLLLERVRALYALHEHDGRLHHLPAYRVRSGADAAFQHVRKLHDDVLDLGRAYAVSGGLYDVVGAPDVVVVAVLVLPCGAALRGGLIQKSG